MATYQGLAMDNQVPSLTLGQWLPIDGGDSKPYVLPAHHLTTHGVVVGMTGSGKTGLLTVMVEEALGAGVPTLVIDIKGDLPNLLLAFPSFSPEAILPWAEASRKPADSRPAETIAASMAEDRKAHLAAWGIDETKLKDWNARTAIRVLTPGSTAGEPLHLLSALEQRSALWDKDLESARATLSASVSLILRLLGRDPDPAKSREHVFLSVLAERRLLAGQSAPLSALLDDVHSPPVEEIGALPINEFLTKNERKSLAAALNALLSSPTFATWRQGALLDVGEWLAPKDGRTPGVVVSISHLDDQERAVVLGILFEEILTWVRTLPGSQRLKALIVFDEVYGFIPPHPANPPTKRPLVALMKQARAFGVGVILATQNPMDLDYRALSNAGFWAVGRLQTDADRERIVDGLVSSSDRDEIEDLGRTVQHLTPRFFVVRDVQDGGQNVIVQPRWAMSVLRGPMTGAELQRAREAYEKTTRAGKVVGTGTTTDEGKT
jgi:hypothetical protein